MKHGPRRQLRHLVGVVVVTRRFAPGRPHVARLQAGPVTVLAAIGRAGVSYRKREGDGATPAGAYELRKRLFRKDRLNRLRSAEALSPVRRDTGWSDDQRSFRYNREIVAGAPENHERIWRDDHVYDVVLTTSHNERPRIRGAGSAIFLHLARSSYEPTEGCVAISLADMRRLLPRLSAKAKLIIRP